MASRASTVLAALFAYDGDDCVVWPMHRDKHGYGKARIDGRSQFVHRWVCAQHNGPPPAPKLDAAHSCGRGHHGCVTKRHLRWATRKENMADMEAHGTHTRRPRGEAHCRARLTLVDVAAIRASTEASGVLAAKFKVKGCTIANIRARRIWKHAA